MVVGERVWYYRDRIVSVAEVEEVRVVLAGDPLEFRMFKVRLYGGRLEDHVHASQLFSCPSDRARLVTQLRSDERHLRSLREELDEQEEQHVPEVGDDI